MNKTIIEQAQDIRASMDTAGSMLTDAQAETVTDLYPPWSGLSVEYLLDARCRDNELLYRCIQKHTSQEDWSPAATPALWVRTSTEEWPQWIPPQGAHDAYQTGDKCTHNDKKWISDVDNNTWEPGVYGWVEQPA